MYCCQLLSVKHRGAGYRSGSSRRTSIRSGSPLSHKREIRSGRLPRLARIRRLIGLPQWQRRSPWRSSTTALRANENVRLRSARWRIRKGRGNACRTIFHRNKRCRAGSCMARWRCAGDDRDLASGLRSSSGTARRRAWMHQQRADAWMDAGTRAEGRLAGLQASNCDGDSSVVSELIRSANGRRLPSDIEIRHILQRSVVEIRNLRQHVGIPGSGTSQDAVIGIMNVVARVEDVSDEEVRSALLEAADMIRTLRIVADSGIALTLHESEA